MSRHSFLRRRPLSSLLLLVLAVLLVWGWLHRAALQAFPDIISAYTAKEYCSCRYVTGNPAQYCRGYVKQYVPSSLVDDEATRTVTASGLGRSHRAAWQGERQGCRLLPPPS
ncbi:amidase [Pseudomonas sp. DTU_2021_1001937_2_SI_NGA_ILE_001]|uniref:amidase n=1 Tax=Pseudomonas sp. DTU_2021_1001937_2_SI_NGA_ILE_001 TaxID=3077589 RepID=UPI0028FC291C|nr:amidase [Pseudomonas sp. DTU_2021_1001937_2_SI_NGA_ILE_001]WNW11646.1 amidase [Pseudomonas sp. DTU_2021_1001937_2_SI_NGA_ILE_001]